MNFQSFSVTNQRRIGVVAGFTVLAGLLGSCAEMGGQASPVMEVGSFKLDRPEFEKKIADVAAAQLASAQGDTTELKSRMYGTDAKKKTYSPDFTAFVLNDLLVDEAIHQEHAARKLPAIADTVKPSQKVIDSFGGKELFAKLPLGFRQRVSVREARFEAIVGDQTKKLGDPAAFAKKNPDKFLEVCARHILVATEAEAKTIKSELAAGKKFEDLAKAKSTDPGSGANGGDLGCAKPTSYVPTFAEATKTQPVGEVGEPVKSEFGYHIIRVDKRQTQPLAEVKKAMQDPEFVQADVSAALVSRLKTSKVTVDESIAHLEPKGANGFPEIQPKKAKAAAATTVAP